MGNCEEGHGMVMESSKTIYKLVYRNVYDNISEGLKNVSIIFMYVFGEVVGAIGNVWDTLTGLIDFITGVFIGDWDKAWEGAKKAFNGFVNVMKSSVNVVISLINSLINTVIGAINFMIRGLNRISFDLPGWLGGGHFGLKYS